MADSIFPLPPNRLSFWFNGDSRRLYAISDATSVSDNAEFEYDFKGKFWSRFKSMGDFLTNTDFSEPFTGE
ncbi:hypothetical protein [Helicobacter suis]|uniref:hypothetical protein n=1 Tax=Helicobacter suis TaxID=104628 RepID=UPI0013D75BB4|nr:hypothetical protein [Helicobacter suis]